MIPIDTLPCWVLMFLVGAGFAVRRVYRHFKPQPPEE